MIQIEDLSKQYYGSKTKALDHINLTIKPGILGLVGENGAGKTTLIKILATMLKKTSGKIHIGDYELPKDELKIRQSLGYLPQNFNLFNTLTVYEAMDYIASLKNIPPHIRKEEIPRLLEEVHLQNKSQEQIKKLSGGMKQRLGIATSLLGNPSFIIMDEPTVGLDPTERLNFRNLLSKYADDRIIILSSHIISDISMLCHDIAIMQKGTMTYSGSTSQLIKSMRNKIYVTSIDKKQEINPQYQKNIISISLKEERLEVRFFSDTVPNFENTVCVEPCLEDAYFYITSKSGDLK